MREILWMISDTHMHHKSLKIPEDLWMVICAGDESNSSNTFSNYNESFTFFNWFETLDIKHKVFIPGNHSTAIEKRIMHPDDIKARGIHFLEHEAVEIDGIKIFGSPYTPSFGMGWAYNVRRDRLTEYWKAIPDKLDILVTHGPPKRILDLSLSPDGYLEYCGDEALYKAVLSRDIKYHQFGHIHDCKGVMNAGTKTIANCNTVFMNTSCVTDGKMNELSSHGQIIEI